MDLLYILLQVYMMMQVMMAPPNSPTIVSILWLPNQVQLYFHLNFQAKCLPGSQNPIICYITVETFLGTKPRLDSYSVPEETPEENIRPIKYPVAAENDNSVASYESPAVVKDLTKDSIVEGDDEVLKSQEITHAPMREFVGPYIKFSQKQLISRTERARLIKAGFEPILDKDGHIITSIGPSYAEREQLKIKLDLEEKDKLRQNDISFTFMGVTFKDGIFELFF